MRLNICRGHDYDSMEAAIRDGAAYSIEINDSSFNDVVSAIGETAHMMDAFAEVIIEICATKGEHNEI